MLLAKQIIAIILSFAFVFLWSITPLASYTLSLLGVLIFMYIVLSTKLKRVSNLIDNGGTKSVLVLNIAILLFIVSTNGLHSPLFFLLYFVLFGIAFVFEPVVVFVYALAATGLFMPQLLEGDIMGNLPAIGSLFLIAPLAFFFGKEYKERMGQDKKLDDIKATSQKAAETIEKDVEELLQDSTTLSPSSKEKLTEVIEEAEELRQKSK